MTSIKQECNFVNNSPSAVRSVAAGGLAALRSNWTIYYFATGRTPEAVADVDVYGRVRPVYCRLHLSTSSLGSANIGKTEPIRNIWRAARAYRDFIALTFLDTIYSHVNSRMVLR